MLEACNFTLLRIVCEWETCCFNLLRRQLSRRLFFLNFFSIIQLMFILIHYMKETLKITGWPSAISTKEHYCFIYNLFVNLFKCVYMHKFEGARLCHRQCFSICLVFSLVYHSFSLSLAYLTYNTSIKYVPVK